MGDLTGQCLALSSICRGTLLPSLQLPSCYCIFSFPSSPDPLQQMETTCQGPAQHRNNLLFRRDTGLWFCSWQDIITSGHHSKLCLLLWLVTFKSLLPSFNIFLDCLVLQMCYTESVGKPLFTFSPDFESW